MKFKLTIILLISIIIIETGHAQRNVFLDNTEASVILYGDARKYEFVIEDVDSHFDKENMNIKVLFPVKNIKANNPNHLEMIEPLLKPFLYPVMSLVVNISDETKNLNTYRDPVKMRKPAKMEFRGNQYEVPVQISLFSDGSSLFYNMYFRINLEEMDLLITDKAMLGLTGIMEFLVSDGEWAEYFVDVY